VNDFKSFTNKVESLYKKYQQSILVEKYLAGREFTVAILKDFTNNNLKVAPIEIIPPVGLNKARILGEKVKKRRH